MKRNNEMDQRMLQPLNKEESHISTILNDVSKASCSDKRHVKGDNEGKEESKISQAARGKRDDQSKESYHDKEENKEEINLLTCFNATTLHSLNFFFCQYLPHLPN